MLDDATRQKALARGKPEPKDVPWWGEPNLGVWYTEAEVSAIVAAVRESMDWTVGFGPDARQIAEFEEKFAAYCGAKHAVAINSCGTGLDMAMRALALEPGDEVICPAVNYKAAHLAIIDRGATVVFCDIDERTLNLDPADLESRVTPRTRAIYPVHMNGLPAPMDELRDITERHQHPKYGPPKIIYDAARACGAGYKGRRVGADGWLTAFSFHTQKLMTTLGEGGMITTDDDSLARRLRDMRQFGGEEEWGSNYKMTKVQAAVGLVQLARLDEMNQQRRQAARRRTQYLEGLEGVTLPAEPPDYEHVYYVFGILVAEGLGGAGRDEIIRIMRENHGIHCSVSNPPTYLRWPYIARHCRHENLPVSEDVGRRLICPPLHPLLTEEQELYISVSLTEAVRTVYGSG